jgi:DNA-binding NtrC family response regulator
VLVHDAEDFATEAATGLRNVGYEVAVFTNPNAALDALEAAETVEVLITRVNFPAGKPNGVSLALMTRTRRPDIRIVFTAVAETEPYTEGIGEFLPMPVHIPDLVATVLRLLPQPPASSAWAESV